MRHSEKTMRKMLLALLEGNGFVTLSSLSQGLDISKRSVQNYLNKADGWLTEHELPNVRIVKKQGYGIRLDMDAADRQTLATLLNNQYFTMADGSANRRVELLRSLIFSREELTIQFLADSFYVSRFVILSDLDWAENWLGQYQLRLFKTQGRGIGIAGDEVARRSAIAGFFDLCERRGPAAVGQADPVRLAKERLERWNRSTPRRISKRFAASLRRRSGNLTSSWAANTSPPWPPTSPSAFPAAPRPSDQQGISPAGRGIPPAGDEHGPLYRRAAGGDLPDPAARIGVHLYLHPSDEL